MDITNLPDDVIREIYDWIPRHIRASLCVREYITYKSFIQKRVRSNYKKYRRFVRSLIRQDNVSLFEEYLEMDGIRWSRILRWQEDGYHTSYLHFLRYLTHKFESSRCLYCINSFMERNNISIL